MAKTLNALVYPGNPTVVADRRMIDLATIPAHKSSWWKPVVVVGDDVFDPATQKKTGPVTTIEETQVVDTYAVVSLSPAELSSAKDGAVESINGQFKPLLKILLDHENRLREQHAPPQSALNMVQFKAYMKTLL